MTHALLPVAGVRLAAFPAGIKYADRNDVALIELAEGSSCAAVFTQNAFRAAPVTLAEQHLQQSATRLLVINSGNANAGTGEAGMQAAKAVCSMSAELFSIPAESVLPFSTGVIGELLPSEKIISALPGGVQNLQQENWSDAAAAIMTTDTCPKAVSRKIELSGGSVVVTGVAKGSGMICPNMATMLGFVATDANIPQAALHRMLKEAVVDSFNAISVDGDTSTNDACVLIASGQSGVILQDADDQLIFQNALNDLFEELALMIVRDGEGATRCVTVQVGSARDRDEARTVAYAIAHSPLVKTALFAGDANWGRILAAVGNAEIDALDVGNVSISLDDISIVERGAIAAGYTEEAGAAVFAKKEFTISVELGRGDEAARIFTTDLSHEYVRINAEYRS